MDESDEEQFPSLPPLSVTSNQGSKKQGRGLLSRIWKQNSDENPLVTPKVGATPRDLSQAQVCGTNIN